MTRWPVGMSWPPDGDEAKYGPWLALSHGTEIQAADGGVWRLSVVDCGDLVLPKGQLMPVTRSPPWRSRWTARSSRCRRGGTRCG